MGESLDLSPSRTPIVEATVESDEPTGRVVLTAVAAVSDRPLRNLPSLYARVDPDALDALFAPGSTRGTVAFPYDGFVVVVMADERVEVYDEDGSS